MFAATCLFCKSLFKLLHFQFPFLFLLPSGSKCVYTICTKYICSYPISLHSRQGLVSLSPILQYLQRSYWLKPIGETKPIYSHCKKSFQDALLFILLGFTLLDVFWSWTKTARKHLQAFVCFWLKSGRLCDTQINYDVLCSTVLNEIQIQQLLLYLEEINKIIGYVLHRGGGWGSYLIIILLNFPY